MLDLQAPVERGDLRLPSLELGRACRQGQPPLVQRVALQPGQQLRGAPHQAARASAVASAAARAAKASLARAALARILLQQVLERRMHRDGAIELGVAAGAIGAETDQLGHVGMKAHQPSRLADQRPLVRSIAAGGRARDAAQHVDGREAAALGDGPLQHDVPVENAAHRVAHRLVGVVALDQHGEQAGDAAVALPGPARSSRRGSSANTPGG